MADVTSLVSTRTRALVAAIAVAVSAALVSAPIALGAGDPIASGKFNLKLSGGFKKQLKKNGVSMKPKSFKLGTGSNLDPITGAGRMRLGKVTFKKGGKKIVFKNLKATLGANGKKGSITGNADGTIKIFSLKGGKVARDGFGAGLKGVKVKFVKGAARKINNKLELNSLKAGKAGSLSVSEQPKTVEVTSGFVFVDVPLAYLPADGSTVLPGAGAEPNAVAAKQPSHCMSPLSGVVIIPGDDPSNPARLATASAFDPVIGGPGAGNAARFRFPVVGGTVGPDGKAGSLQLNGGIRLRSGGFPMDSFFPQPDGTGEPFSCAFEEPDVDPSRSVIETTFFHGTDAKIGPNLALANIQSYVDIGGAKPGCNFADPNNPPGCSAAAIGGPGFKGPAIGQVVDTSATVVAADPAAKTVSVSGDLVRINGLTAQTFNLIFPNASGNPAKDFADGDKFGISRFNVNTR